MPSRKKKRNAHNKTRTNKGGNTPIPTTKTIDDYLEDNIFPILSNEYITIELETCIEGNENSKYNYKVSSIKKQTFTRGAPEYTEYPTLTMEELQNGIHNIHKLNLKDPNSFIRLMIISGKEGLKIWKLDNQKYEANTNNKEKCGYGMPIYGMPIYEEIVPPVKKDLILEDIEGNWDMVEKEMVDKEMVDKKKQATENETRKLQAKEERLAEEARVAAEAKAEEERFAEESVVDYIPAPEDIEQQMLSFTLDKLTKINKNKNLNDELKLVFADFNSEFEGEDIPGNLQKMFEDSLSNDESIQKKNIDLLLNGVQLLIIYEEINKKIEPLKEIGDDERLEFNDIYGLLEETEFTSTKIIINEEEKDIFEVMDEIVNFNTLKPDQTENILQIQEHVKEEIDIIIGKLTNPDRLDDEDESVVKPKDELLLKSLSNQEFYDDEDEKLLEKIREITDQVKQTKYKDDKNKISKNMIKLKLLVDELDKKSTLLTPISPIPTIVGKVKCNTALNYIKNNQGESIYNDDLYDDYAMVNDKYETYITYKTGWLSDDFEEHKQNFIKELVRFNEKLLKDVFSTFEYGDSEYCKDISPNNNDDLIKSVEDANKQAVTALAQDDSVINNRVNPDKNTLLRSNSAHSGLRKPLFPQPTQNKIKQFTALPGFIEEAKNQKMNKDEAFNLWNKDKPRSSHETLRRFSSYWDWDKQTGKGKKTKKKRTTRSKKQKSNTKTVKNMERKRKTRKNTK